MKRLIHYPAYIIPIVFLVVMVILAISEAPTLFNEYVDPLSWLGGQELDQGWLMNSGWIGFGAMMIIITIGYHYHEDWSSAITYPLIAFGMSVIFMGIWKSDHPFTTMALNLEEANEHMMFYGIAIGSIVLGMMVHLILSKDKKSRLFHGVLMGVLIIEVVLIWMTHSIDGIFERMLWITIFIWLSTWMGRVTSNGYNR